MDNVLRQGEYGIDGNLIGVIVMALSAIVGTIAVPFLVHANLPVAAAIAAFVGVSFLSTLAVYLHTTRRGKFLVWNELLDTLQLRGDERVLDVGCGRGAVITMIAKRLPQGHCVGIDLWSTADQSGNGLQAAQRNLAAEGVTARCELVTGDARNMPFAESSFELIVSSLAIHNIASQEERQRAIDEIARVVAPGGRIALADLAFTQAYAQRLAALGFIDIKRRNLGWRFWWMPLVMPTVLITATKPG